MDGASLATAAARVNGVISPSPAEDEALYAQLLQLCDTVLAGKHSSFKLPASAVQRLKTALLEPRAQSPEHQHALLNSAVNGSPIATNHAQLRQSSMDTWQNAAPPQHLTNGFTPVYAASKPAAVSTLDPIFLEKSDVVIRAEGQLKRQRLDRDLQAQVDQRKHSARDRDPGLEAPSTLDIDAVLLSALDLVKPTSGLKEVDTSDASSSFDENDYYSSQVQSDWFSEASTSKGSDRAAGAFVADFERLDATKPSLHRKQPSIPNAGSRQFSKEHPHFYTHEPEYAGVIGDDDDEYTPPDAAAFDSFVDEAPITPDDDNSEYEPGEIADTNVPTPQYQVQQPSPQVPVIRNHLTHIAAPQPNRVSPLATAKGPAFELELVNGRPEVVQKPAPQRKQIHSRASTASPSGTGAAESSKKRRNKKRKRDTEPSRRSKRRREKQAAIDVVPDEPYIKDEPMSPPPFALSNVAPHRQGQSQQQPINIDLPSPHYAPQIQYVQAPQGADVRYDPMRTTSPAYVRVASRTAQRPLQRDNQDLRRVASLHYAQIPPSPQRNLYSPVAPYRTVSANHNLNPGSSLRPIEEDQRSRYALPEPSYTTRSERSRSPPRDQEFRDYGLVRAPSSALMPPPAAPARQIIVDQNGNRYYAADPVPASRSSVMPAERPQSRISSYDRGGAHGGLSYDQIPSTPSNNYRMTGSEMVSQPPPSRRQPLPDPYAQQDHSSGHMQEYHQRQVEPTRFSQAPPSPRTRSYEQMPPPPRQQAISAAPAYAPPRSYSVRPEETQEMQQPVSSYLRHASVAPVQYVRQDAPPPPMRAMSVMPGNEYGDGVGLVQQQHHRPQYAQPQQQQPQPLHGVRYVDQFGNEVFPREIREVRY